MKSWHRFYDPTTGRYISADPIGIAGGINLYGYAYQSPLQYVDFNGLECRIEVNDDYRDRTGLTRFANFRTDEPPFWKKAICSHPRTICKDYLYEYKDEEEQWAVYEAVYEVCRDECGRLLGEPKLLSKTKKDGSEYWVYIATWRRKSLYMEGVNFSDPGYPWVKDGPNDTGWEKI